jgi:hypothetical protein
MTAKTFALVPLLAIATLSACSKQSEVEPTVAATTEFVPEDSIPSDIAPEPSAVPVAPPAAESSGEMSAISAATSIPATAQGRWGMVAADCTSTRGDAKGLLVIDGKTMKFYESVGRIGAVKERSDTRIRAAFSFSGEGMTWTNDEVLDVQDGGKVLIRREYGEGASPGPLRYMRCD